MANNVSTKIITGPNVRFSYLNVFEPKAMAEGLAPKYSASLIISKNDKKTIDAIKKGISAVYEKEAAKLQGASKSVPPLSVIKTPLRDGDTERPGDPAYKNCYFINANSNLKPGIVDENRDPILDRSEFYSGCYGRASITLFAYNVNGNKGIGASLNHLQKFSDGEPLGGRTSAAIDFATDPDDEDFLN